MPRDDRARSGNSAGSGAGGRVGFAASAPPTSTAQRRGRRAGRPARSASSADPNPDGYRPPAAPTRCRSEPAQGATSSELDSTRGHSGRGLPRPSTIRRRRFATRSPGGARRVRSPSTSPTGRHRASCALHAMSLVTDADPPAGFGDTGMGIQGALRVRHPTPPPPGRNRRRWRETDARPVGYPPGGRGRRDQSFGACRPGF